MPKSTNFYAVPTSAAVEAIAMEVGVQRLTAAERLQLAAIIVDDTLWACLGDLPENGAATRFEHDCGTMTRRLKLLADRAAKLAPVAAE